VVHESVGTLRQGISSKELRRVLAKAVVQPTEKGKRHERWIIARALFFWDAREVDASACPECAAVLRNCKLCFQPTGSVRAKAARRPINRAAEASSKALVKVRFGRMTLL
jgi:hypothetical protein